MATVSVVNHGFGIFYLVCTGSNEFIYSAAWNNNKRSIMDYRLHFLSSELAIKWARYCGYDVQDGEKLLKKQTIDHKKFNLSVELENKIIANRAISKVRKIAK